MSIEPIAPLDIHKLEIVFSRELLAAAPHAPRTAAAKNSVPDWVEPKVCHCTGSRTVRYTWEWRTARFVDPIVERP